MHRTLRTAAALLALALFAAACGDDESSAPTTTAEVTTTTAPDVAVTAPYGIDRFDTTVVDTSRVPARTIDLQVTFPVEGDGPFPLIVFGHGLGGSPAYLEALTEAWAAQGFVVAAPFFPFS
ncbi:MAG: hypothetical protein MUE34_18565, partial [Acidimicrobiales bacterium]|nr:hypothetical protein [Acidimicrobiales bacterium]